MFIFLVEAILKVLLACLLYTSAQRDIEREKMMAEKDIKKEITEVAFLAAEKIVGKELNDEEQKKYIDDFINNAGETPWQG